MKKIIKTIGGNHFLLHNIGLEYDIARYRAQYEKLTYNEFLEFSLREEADIRQSVALNNSLT